MYSQEEIDINNKFIKKVYVPFLVLVSAVLFINFLLKHYNTSEKIEIGSADKYSIVSNYIESLTNYYTSVLFVQYSTNNDGSENDKHMNQIRENYLVSLNTLLAYLPENSLIKFENESNSLTTRLECYYELEIAKKLEFTVEKINNIKSKYSKKTYSASLQIPLAEINSLNTDSLKSVFTEKRDKLISYIHQI